MANHSTNLCFAIELPTEGAVETAMNLGIKIEEWAETYESDGPEPIDPELEAFRDTDCMVLPVLTGSGSELVIGDDGGEVNIEFVALFVQQLLIRFKMTSTVVGFEWANTCSRAMLGSNGGGAVAISVKDIRFHSTGQARDALCEALQGDL